MIKQTKAKSLHLVPASKLITDDGWFGSIKRDGHYVQVTKKDDAVTFCTSGGKLFFLPCLADKICEEFPQADFTVEGEYNYDCLGKLGDRSSSARLTTYRTDALKGKVTNDSDLDHIILTDILELKENARDDVTANTPFYNRLHFFPRFSDIFREQANIQGTLEAHNAHASRLARLGWEGLYLKHRNHTLQAGKRVNNAIKIKKRPTVDLLCVGVEAGKGKYTGKIGSLVLKDQSGRIVNCSPGDDDNRSLPEDYWVGKVVEIEYEQVLDTYIQPTFVQVRLDKSADESD